MNQIVNYNELWRVLHQRKNSPPVNWDKRAPSFFKAVSNSEGVNEIIGQLNLKKTDTVLDMGAGTGRFAIPMTEYAAHVTALEPSKGMNFYLKQGMEKAGIKNYSLIEKKWEEITIGKDLPVHDVVFASNSLAFTDLAKGLKKLNDAAKRAVHILWFAGQKRHMLDEELIKLLGDDYESSFDTDYLFIVNVLHDLGIYANVSVTKIQSRQYFDNIDEAVTWWTEHDNIPTSCVPVVKEYFINTLQKTPDNRLFRPILNKQVRIWWEKECCSE